MLRHSFGFVGFFLFAFHFQAQQTAVYTDELRPYKTANELYQQKKYGAALKQFNRFIAYAQTHNREDAYHEQYLDALFYRAQSANELDQPQAENYFLDLVRTHESTPVTRMSFFYLGNIYYKQKKYDKAISWFQQVDVADLNAEQLTDYRFQLGYCYFFKKKFDLAEPLFNAVRHIQGKYYHPANYYYGYIQYSKGNYAEANKSFEIIKDTKLYGPVVPYYTASIAFMDRNYDMAIDLATVALENDKLKYQDELKQLIGKSYFNLGQYDKALPYLKEYFDKSARSDKTDIYQLGYANYKLGKYDDATKYFKQLNSLRDSLGQNALYLLGDSYLKTKQKPNARNAFLESSRLSFDPLLQEDASFQYAKLSYELGYQDVAAKTVQEFLNNYPKSKRADEARELLTFIFLSTNNYRDAVAVIQKIENKTPAIKQAYQKVAFGRALQLYNERHYDEALKLFEVSLNNPIDLSMQAQCYFWKGESFYQLRKYGEANINYFKFLEAARLVSDLPLEASAAAGNYGVGYAYVGKDEYNKALQYFEASRAQFAAYNPRTKEEKSYYNAVYPDCILRLGDCHFTLRNYAKATEAYTSVINAKQTGTDYALLQRGMISGLQGNNAAKIKDLERLSNEYGMSVYQDDALFEISDTYLKDERYENAILVFNRIVNDYPSSRFVKNAHLKLGLIYFNTNRTANALDQFRIVAKKYPGTPESKDAIEGIREIYLSKGDAAGLVTELNAIPNAGVTASEKEELVYQAAERLYTEGNCDVALQKLSDYINTFPNGAHAAEAHYYRASCLSQNKDYANALADYNIVIERQDTRFLEKSLLEAARIEFYENKNYSNAFKHYSKLATAADLKANRAEARKGMMLSAYELKNDVGTREAANAILADESSPSADRNLASFHIGLVMHENGQHAEAITHLTKVSKETKTELGAKATYYVAEAYFAQKDYKNAETWANKVINNTPSFDYWLAKSYILIADVFFAEKDYFNAKATLQSIIDNYKKNDGIVPTAQQKLQTVMAAENQTSKVKPEQDQLEEEETPTPNEP